MAESYQSIEISLSGIELDVDEMSFDSMDRASLIDSGEFDDEILDRINAGHFDEEVKLHAEEHGLLESIDYNFIRVCIGNVLAEMVVVGTSGLNMVEVKDGDDIAREIVARIKGE